MTKIFVFPGQGSQTVGMGKDLFSLFPNEVKQANDILGYSIEKLCLEDPEQKLNNTAYTQPVLFIVSALTYLKKKQENVIPNFTAGHSLGEYAALFAAGVFDFATGVKLIQKRGEIMSKAQGGGMAAVVGLNKEQIVEVLKQFPAIDIANFNSPTQTVISGPQTDINNAKSAFEAAGSKMYVVLKVSGAFHSRYMKPAQDEFSEFLKDFSFQAPKTPVIANYTAQAYPNDETGIKHNLAQQISNSVRWVETVQLLKQQPAPEFEELGPGRVLSKLINQIN
jgi:malonyl CoA-acyl carrier protein transacylase